MTTPEIRVAFLAIGAIVFLESMALLRGVDGTMFGAAMAAIGAIIGYVFKSLRGKSAPPQGTP